MIGLALVCLLGAVSPIHAQVPVHSQTGDQTGEESAALQFALATVLAGDGELEDAATAFEAAIAADGNAAIPRIEYAELLLRLQRPEEAVVQAERANELEPRDPTILRALGQVLISVARTDPSAITKAMRVFETLREVDPADLRGMVTLAQIYQNFGRDQDAIDVLEELLRLHTDNHQLKRFLHDALLRAGQKERAAELLQDLIRLEQESLDERLQLAALEMDRGNFSSAIELLEGAVESSEGAPELRMRLAQAFAARSQSPGISAERRAADLESANAVLDELIGEGEASARLLKARLLQASGDLDAARELLAAATEADPENVMPILELARLLAAQGDLDGAADVLDDARASDFDDEAQQQLLWDLSGVRGQQRDWPAVIAIGDELLEMLDEPELRVQVLGRQTRALLRSGRGGRALDLLSKEEKRAGATPWLLLERASLLIEMERPKQALEVLGRDELETAEDPGVQQQMASILLEMGEIDRGVDALRGSLPADGFARTMTIAQMLLMHSHFEAAVPHLEQALASPEIDESQKADAHFLMGQAFERSGEAAQAADQFKAVLELREDDGGAMNYLGYMWADLGVNLEEALGLIERAVELEPNNGAYIDSLGWAQYRLGRYEQARESLRRALTLNPENATIHEHLGDVYLALGLEGEARSSYERALALEDEENVEQVRRKLNELGSGSL